jgi:hypothetical protein
MDYINFINWMLLLFYDVHTLKGPTRTLRRKQTYLTRKIYLHEMKIRQKTPLDDCADLHLRSIFSILPIVQELHLQSLPFFQTFQRPEYFSCIVNLQNVVRGSVYMSADDSEKVKHLAPLSPHENSTRGKWSVRNFHTEGDCWRKFETERSSTKIFHREVLRNTNASNK